MSDWRVLDEGFKIPKPDPERFSRKPLGKLFSRKVTKFKVKHFSWIKSKDRKITSYLDSYYNTDCSVPDCTKTETVWVEIDIDIKDHEAGPLFVYDQLETMYYYSGYVCLDCLNYLKFKLSIV